MTDVETRVRQYVELRDLIKTKEKEFQDMIAPYREALHDLNSSLLNHLNTTKVNSVSTSAGTFYRTSKKTASLADGDAFWTFVVTQGLWGLVDRRANVTAVEDYIKQHGTPPPGVNYNVRQEVGVRRK